MLPVPIDVLLARLDAQVERLWRDRERAFWSTMLAAAPDVDVDALQELADDQWQAVRDQWAAERPRIVAALREAR